MSYCSFPRRFCNPQIMTNAQFGLRHKKKSSNSMIDEQFSVLLIVILWLTLVNVRGNQKRQNMVLTNLIRQVRLFLTQDQDRQENCLFYQPQKVRRFIWKSLKWKKRRHNFDLRYIARSLSNKPDVFASTMSFHGFIAQHRHALWTIPELTHNSTWDLQTHNQTVWFVFEIAISRAFHKQLLSAASRRYFGVFYLFM